VRAQAAAVEAAAELTDGEYWAWARRAAESVNQAEATSPPLPPPDAAERLGDVTAAAAAARPWSTRMGAEEAYAGEAVEEAERGDAVEEADAGEAVEEAERGEARESDAEEAPSTPERDERWRTVGHEVGRAVQYTPTPPRVWREGDGPWRTSSSAIGSTPPPALAPLPATEESSATVADSAAPLPALPLPGAVAVQADAPKDFSAPAASTEAVEAAAVRATVRDDDGLGALIDTLRRRVVEGSVPLQEQEEEEEEEEEEQGQGVPLEQVVRECLLRPVRAQYQLVSRCVRAVLMDELQLRDHCLALRRFFFMVRLRLPTS
jgi:hypothetical protein